MPPVIVAIAAVALDAIITASATIAGITVLGVTIGTAGAAIIGSLAAAGVMALGQYLLTPAQKRTLSFREPLASHKVIYGQMKVGGAMTFVDTSSDNSVLYLVVTLAGHPVFSIDGIYVNDTYVPLDSSGNAQEAVVWPDGTKPTNYHNHCTIIKGLGTVAGDAAFLTAVSTNSPKWGANFFQYSRGKLYCQFGWNQNLFGSTGVPNVSAVVRGRMVFDPRDTNYTITTSSTGIGLFHTSSAHPLAVGDMVFIKGHSGASPISQPSWPAAQRNGVAQEYEVNTVPSSTSFTLRGIDSQPLVLTAGGSGGSVTKMRWTDNSVLMANDYLVEPVHGMAVLYDTEVDENLVISGANLCDETVARAIPISTFTADPTSNQITWVENLPAGALPPLCQLVLTTTGTLPGGLSASTVYYYAQTGGGPTGVLCTTSTHAAHIPPVSVDITSTGSGVHTLTIVESVTPDHTTGQLGVYNNSLRVTTGTEVLLSNFGGGVPSGLSAGTSYWAIFLSDIIIQLAATLEDARLGNALSFTNNGSGTTFVSVEAEPRYTANGVIDSAESRQTIVQKLLSSCGGYLVPSGTFLNIYPAQYLTPTVTLDEGDLRGPINVTTLQSGSASFNSVKGTFVDPFNKGQPTDYPNLQNTTYLAADQYEVVWKDLTLEFTNSSSMAQRLAKIDLERIRRELTVTMPLKLTAFRVGSPDVININNQMWGWTDETFEVSSWRFSIEGAKDRPTLNCDIVGRQTDSAVYAFTSAEEQAAKRQTNTNLPNPFVVQPPTGLTLASGGALIVQQPDGTLVSRIEVSWTSPADQFVLSGGFIEVAYKLHSAGTWTFIGSWVPGDATFGFIENAAIGVQYDIAVRARNAIGGVSDEVGAFPWQAEIDSYTVQGKSNAPSDISAITVTVNGQTVELTATPITDTDVTSYEYRYLAPTSSPPSPPAWSAMTVIAQANALPNGSGGFAGAYTVGSIPAGSYYFAVKAINRSGTYSVNAAFSSLTVVTVSNIIGPGSVDAAAFAAGIQPVFELSGAPPSTPGTYDAQVAVSTTDRQLYRWNASTSQWTLDVPVVNLVGQILPSNLGIDSTANIILDQSTSNAAYWISEDSPGQPTQFTGAGSPWLSTTLIAQNTETTSPFTAEIRSPRFPCRGGVDQFFASFDAALAGASTTTLQGYIIYWNEVGTFIGQTTIGAAIPATSTTFTRSGSGGAPAGATRVQFSLQHTSLDSAPNLFLLGSPVLRLKSSSELIEDAAIEAQHVAPGAITPPAVATGAITASKMFIGSTDNLVLDGNCVDANYWQWWGSANSLVPIVNAGGAWITAKILNWTSTASGWGYWSAPAACKPGDTFQLSCTAATAGGVTFQLFAVFLDAGGSDVGNLLIDATTSGPIVQLSGVATAPAGTAYVSLLGYTPNPGNVGMGAPVLRRMYTGSLIVDGTIQANNIAANTITAAQIAANTITATQIAAATITATQIAAATITGTNIAASTLTSGLIAANAITAGAIAAGAINAGNIIVNNIIVTGHLTAGSVTSWSTLSTTTSGITTSELNPFASNVSVTVDASTKVLLQFSGSFTRTGGTSPMITFRIYANLNTTPLAEGACGGSGIAQAENFIVSFVDLTPTAGGGARPVPGLYHCTAFIASGTTSPCTYNNAVFLALAGQR